MSEPRRKRRGEGYAACADDSPCGSSCGSPRLTHFLIHIIFTQNRTKTPEIQRFQEFLGAAIQI